MILNLALLAEEVLKVDEITDGPFVFHISKPILWFSLPELIIFQSGVIESDRIKEGGKYIDFSNPDFKGNNHTLSEEIGDKIALLDLWASWCGPCRRKSKEMIPIYNEFKEKGFTIVGVAREFEKVDGEHAIEKDGYTWLNLLELKDANNIWYRYGVGNGGGATFLIDKDGTILKIDPSAEEVREILNEKLK